MSLRLFVIY